MRLPCRRDFEVQLVGKLEFSPIQFQRVTVPEMLLCLVGGGDKFH